MKFSISALSSCEMTYNYTHFLLVVEIELPIYYIQSNKVNHVVLLKKSDVYDLIFNYHLKKQSIFFLMRTT